MNSFRLSFATVAAVLLCAGSAHALSLTGTWEGSESCTSFTGTTSKTKLAAMVAITQFDVDLNVQISGAFLAGTYNGVALADVADDAKGQGGFLRCGASSSTYILGSHAVKTDPGSGEGKLKLRLTYVAHGLEQGVVICKYSLKRTSTADPGIAACP